MKILLSTGSYPPDIGGPATYSELLYHELPQKGITVDVLSFGMVRHLPKIFRHLNFLWKLIWHGREADLIYAQDASSVGMPSLVAALILGKPFVVRVPGDYAWEQSGRFGVSDSMQEFQKKKYGWKLELLRKIQGTVVNNADSIIVPSKAFTEVVKSWVKDPVKVQTIYNGIDLKEVEKVASVQGVVKKTKMIVSAGRLVPGKGFETLIKSMAALPDWSLEIVGDGPEEEKLKVLIEKMNLKGRVTLLGRLSKPELIGKIARAEVFALNTHYETFSFQIVEAMAAGTPVVATSVGSLPEIIDSGMSGILVKPESEDELVAAIKNLDANLELKNKIVNEGKKKSKQFSIENTVEAVRKILVSLISEPRISGRKRVAASKIVRYIFSGGMAAFTDIGLLYVFTDLIGMWYLASSILAFLVAFVVSFMLQKFFTFQDHNMHGIHGQALLYLVVTGTNLLINTALMYMFVQYWGVHYILAQIVTSIIIAIESFIIYGMFIFNRTPKKQAL